MSLHISDLSPIAHGRSAPELPARAFSPRRLIPATGAALAASLVGVLTIRGLAVTSAERWPSLPDLPTMAEAGMADFKVTSWGALAVPAATPAPIVAMLSETVQAIAAEPAVQERFMAIGAKLVASTPQDATAYALRERQRWGAFVRDAGIKAE